MLPEQLPTQNPEPTLQTLTQNPAPDPSDPLAAYGPPPDAPPPVDPVTAGRKRAWLYLIAWLAFVYGVAWLLGFFR